MKSSEAVGAVELDVDGRLGQRDRRGVVLQLRQRLTGLRRGRRLRLRLLVDAGNGLGRRLARLIQDFACKLVEGVVYLLGRGIGSGALAPGFRDPRPSSAPSRLSGDDLDLSLCAAILLALDQDDHRLPAIADEEGEQAVVVLLGGTLGLLRLLLDRPGRPAVGSEAFLQERPSSRRRCRPWVHRR